MKSYCILIVDDHSMIRDGLKNLLGNNPDYVVTGEAATGSEALELYSALQPDLVIMDISMPDMNGMDVAAKILELDGNANIVMFSMYDGEDYISRCIEVGVKGYVLKNESGSELDYAIKCIRKGSNYFSRHAQDVIFRKYTRAVGSKKKQDDLVKLTQRELEIVKLIAEGLTSQQMADKLFISPRTVETHRANLMKKVGVHNAIELVKKVQQLQLI